MNNIMVIIQHRVIILADWTRQNRMYKEDLDGWHKGQYEQFVH